MSTPIDFADLIEKRDALLAEVWETENGLGWAESHSEIFDEALRRIVQQTEQIHGVNNLVVLLATGGYGRSEVGPASDLDIAVAPDGPMTVKTEEFVRTLFQTIQTSIPKQFGCTVGYAFVTKADLPGLDERMLTALMDMRRVTGSTITIRNFREAYWEALDVGPFLASKMSERRRAWRVTHDTPLVVQPDLKEGAGGLRCFQAANWLHQAIGGRALRPDDAYDLVLRSRHRLMMLTGKSTGPLTRQRAKEMSDRLGIVTEHMLDELLSAMTRLHEAYQAAERQIKETRFPLSSNVVALMGEVRIGAGATAGEIAQAIATALPLGLDVGPLRVPVEASVAGVDVTAALATGEKTVRLLDRAGVLEILLPELTNCRTLVPADPPHVFTVFEHTLRALRAYDEIGTTGFLAEVKDELDDQEAVVLALLLHDVGKCQIVEPHEIYGARIVREVANRWKLPPSLSEDAEWLVENHLLLSQFIRLRDVMNAETATDLAQRVNTIDRLNALTILTWCDVVSVHPEVWSPLQQTFMEELYRRTKGLLEHETDRPDDMRARRRLRKQLAAAAEETKVESFLASLPPHYVLSHPPDEVREHYVLAEKATEGVPAMMWKDYRELGASDFTVSNLDRPGLLQTLLGIIYANDLSITGLRASTTTGDTPVILDQFTINLAGRSLPDRAKQKLERELASVLSGERNLEDLMRDHGKSPDRPQEIFRWSYQSGPPGILEITAPRGRGMAFRMSRLISENGWVITAARLGQWAGQGAAAFYIADKNGIAPSLAVVSQALEPIPDI
ncbi:MAG: HD domain-containing protein [Fimbriimonadaceae bacterium]|nr:HD domain-containing protein [Fimbriimonadaceae bacterium]